VKLFRRAVLVMLVAVYLGMSLAQAAAMPPPTMAGGMMQDASGDAMPCKGKLPAHGCVTDLGCILLISLAAFSDLNIVIASKWLSVGYGGFEAVLRGLSIKPALGPPISHA
jgi:hypothetical protein